jgi:type IV secretion system protein VirB3
MAITHDTLFVAVTRPTLIGGVPYVAFIANAMISFLVFMATNNPLYLVIALPLHGIFYLMCAKEPRIFELLNLWSITKGRNLNSRFWNASSYSPFEKPREKQIIEKKDKKNRDK